MKGIITTNSGIHFDLLHPTDDMFCIKDIAHHLSHISRFTGALDHDYTVAQHSLYCSWIIKPEYALDALMHDATEAYLGDVSNPLKQLLPEYRRLEAHIWVALCRKYGLSNPLPHEVKVADARAYIKERSILFSSAPGIKDGLHDHLGYVQMPARKLQPGVSPWIVRMWFLQRFHELMEARNG